MTKYEDKWPEMWFLANLRGIETWVILPICGQQYSFLANLRGIETYISADSSYASKSFLANLRGIETCPAFHSIR